MNDRAHWAAAAEAWSRTQALTKGLWDFIATMRRPPRGRTSIRPTSGRALYMAIARATLRAGLPLPPLAPTTWSNLQFSKPFLMAAGGHVSLSIVCPGQVIIGIAMVDVSRSFSTSSFAHSLWRSAPGFLVASDSPAAVDLTSTFAALVGLPEVGEHIAVRFTLWAPRWWPTQVLSARAVVLP